MRLCNAKNHRWNCDCGFGGAKVSVSLQRAGVKSSEDSFIPTVPRRYTKPNERCAFCDAPVFFRRLANGGSVYFDEPGAPWPKHPCTDQTSMFYLGTFSEANGGWPQVTQLSVEAVDPGVLSLTGSLLGRDWSTFVRASAFGVTSTSAAHISASFIQANAGPSGRFNLAVLTHDLRRRLVVGYPTAAITVSDQA